MSLHISRLKRKAEENPEMPPAQILRLELPNVPDEVIAQLPERENLKKSIRRQRRQNLPVNPKSLADLLEIPDRYKNTLVGDNFLMHDSHEDDNRVIVFGSRRNLELLARSPVWFLDGTFKVSPVIFTQVFTILGLVERNAAARDDQQQEVNQLPVPLVYALLSSKESVQYKTVLRAVANKAREYHIANCQPQKIITDFEMSIITACTTVFPNVPVSCCFFHLCQSIYRRVQSEGLQVAYSDPEDSSLRLYVKKLLALAFVPIADVAAVFNLLDTNAPEELEDIVDYFGKTYVIGVPARGRRRARQPRYPPRLWNQYTAAREGSHRTNNISEGWHNRF